MIKFRKEGKKFVDWCLRNGHAKAVEKDLKRRRRRQEWVFLELPKNFTNDKRDYYRQEYLKSDHWRELKKRKLSINDHCEKCNSDIHLDVHHIDYKNLYDVELTDLETLCRKCHTIKHENQQISWKDKYISTYGKPRVSDFYDDSDEGWLTFKEFKKMDFTGFFKPNTA